MKQSLVSVIGVTLLAFSLLAPANRSLAEEATQDAVSQPRRSGPGFFPILGSIFFTPVHLVVKTVTCVGTQVGGGAAYVATYGVEGHYDGGTNGRDIGETARRACTGSWIVRPSQVARDYRE